MTTEEFSKELALLLAEFFKGVPIGDVPTQMRFQLWEEHPDPQAPLHVTITVRRGWHA